MPIFGTIMTIAYEEKTQKFNLVVEKLKTTEYCQHLTAYIIHYNEDSMLQTYEIDTLAHQTPLDAYLL